MTSKSLLRTILAWFVAAIFIFPIYFWVTVSIKKDKDIFAIPPKLISFEPSFKAYEVVLGISSFLYVQEMGNVRPGGGEFYMMPRIVDSIVIALGSTGIAMMISLLAAYSLSINFSNLVVFDFCLTITFTILFSNSRASNN